MLNIIAFIVGIYFVVVPFIITTHNTKSAVVFKVMPFLSGAYILVYSVIQSGILTLNI